MALATLTVVQGLNPNQQMEQLFIEECMVMVLDLPSILYDDRLPSLSLGRLFS